MEVNVRPHKDRDMLWKSQSHIEAELMSIWKHFEKVTN